jgi:hypothetical protein
MARGLARATLTVVALLGLTAALGAQGGDKAKVGEAVKSDLTRLAELERAWFEKNRTFTTDLRALGFTPTSGANVTMAYASARSWAANATHPTLQPTTCFIVVSQPGSSGSADRPFCSEATGGQVAAAPTQAAPRQQPAAAVPPRTAPQTTTQAPVSKPAAPPPVDPLPRPPHPRRPSSRFRLVRHRTRPPSPRRARPAAWLMRASPKR